MKIRPVGAELFHTDGWTDRHDNGNGRFSQFYEKRLKIFFQVETPKKLLKRKIYGNSVNTSINGKKRRPSFLATPMKPSSLTSIVFPTCPSLPALEQSVSCISTNPNDQY